MKRIQTTVIPKCEPKCANEHENDHVLVALNKAPMFSKITGSQSGYPNDYGV